MGKKNQKGSGGVRTVSRARKVGRVIKTILKSALVVVLAVLMVAVNVMLPGYSRMPNNMVGIDQSWNNSMSTEGVDLQYNKADYTKDSIGDAEKALDQQIAAEGVVMLKNDGDTLPYAAGTKFSFFGENSKLLGASQSMMSMVTGSKTTSDALNSALEAEGFSVNTTLQDFYANGAGKDYNMGPGSVNFGDGENFAINECPLSVMQDADVLDSAKGTTPVFVLRRVAGEGRDMPRSMYNHAASEEDKEKSYLEPDSTELQILQYINDNFDDGLVLVSTASAVELDWLQQFPNIKACLVVPSTGTDGMSSLAGILSGRVNPSGRTVDTFAADALASPAAQNFGDYQYVDMDGNLTRYNYVSYEEGIYVGYKYYETRYEDAIMGQGNAGDFNYADEVCYPFGYGLSYTTFDWSDFSTNWNGEQCTANVTVTNVGNVAGKDVVEVYAQSPYTDYDRANGVEKASVQLVGFAKTDLLAPGESQTVEVSFDRSQLAAYDSRGAGTYIFDAGTYYVTAGRNAHDATNNVLAAKGANVDGNAAMAATYVPENTEVDTTTYATDSLTGQSVTNRFDDARGDVTYLSRADWTGTFPKHDGTPYQGDISDWGGELNATDENGNPVPYTWTKVASDDLLAQLDSTDSGNPNVGGTFPDTPTYGAKNGLTLADMRGLDYDDPAWDSLLDQLTVEDYDVSINRGGYGTVQLESVGKPYNVDADTASYLIYGGTGHAFEGPSTLAQTWNQDLYTAFGNIIGNESLLGGAAGWYAPSMNIHRTPFSGRNGEYYSEDGFLSGVVASRSVRAAAEKGLYATIKHFVLNDQENHRGDREGQYSIATWANEQAIREIYLKPFEMVMKAGNVQEDYVEKASDGTLAQKTREIPVAQAIMTGFNRIGATWVGGDYDLLTGVVRGEWGFNGWIITDNANTGTFMNGKQMIEAGGDTKLTFQDNAGSVWKYEQDNPEAYHFAREAMHHLLYVTANSHVMNGAAPGATINYGLQAVDKIRIGVTVGGAAGIALVFWTGWRNHKKRAAERAAAAAATTSAADGDGGEA